MRYFVELDGSEPGVGYDVTVPDLPGCTSAGDDLDEALRNAKEAIALHLEAMIADGEPVPARTSEPRGAERARRPDRFRRGGLAHAEYVEQGDPPERHDPGACPRADRLRREARRHVAIGVPDPLRADLYRARRAPQRMTAHGPERRRRAAPAGLLDCGGHRRELSATRHEQQLPSTYQAGPGSRPATGRLGAARRRRDRGADTRSRSGTRAFASPHAARWGVGCSARRGSRPIGWRSSTSRSRRR